MVAVQTVCANRRKNLSALLCTQVFLHPSRLKSRVSHGPEVSTDSDLQTVADRGIHNATTE